ncbi:hypothetical protein ACQKFU_31770 [Bacillus mycoides]
MIMNHSDFFDLLQSKEVLPNNQELRQSFELLINGFSDSFPSGFFFS